MSSPILIPSIGLDTVSTSPNALQPANSKPTIARRIRRIGGVILVHFQKHTGMGVVCAVAYFDPGNWGVDLQAGSEYGYRLLFVVLLAGLFAAYLQVLAARLGCVTGIDLASHTRLLLFNRPKHTQLYRWLGLYPLYVLAEVAIIATDLAELLGSAIALCLLFPQLELWHGVLITAFDVLLFFAMGDPLRGRPVKAFELLISALVLAILICMVIIISRVHVNWGNAFDGYVPSKYMFASGGIYTSVGILGATIMPHSLYLGSTLATQDRIHCRDIETDNNGVTSVGSTGSEDSARLEKKISLVQRLCKCCNFKESVLHAFRRPPASAHSTTATRHCEHHNNPLYFIKAHIYHATFDVVGSLLGFAVMINSLILMLASAVFFYGKGQTATDGPASLFDAYDLIRDWVGQSAATLFAIALLCSGQSSSIIATVAGQAVCEGFLQWRVSPVIRRLVTRLIAIVPSMAVALIVGRQGIDTLLVASQVILAIVLPFVTFPLLYCTSSKAIMSVRKTPPVLVSVLTQTPTVDVLSAAVEIRDVGMAENADTDEIVDFSNNKLAVCIGITIWLVIVAANFYAIVELGMGNGA